LQAEADVLEGPALPERVQNSSFDPAWRDHRRPEPAHVQQPPFETDRFRFEGTAAAGTAPGELTLTGKPHNERRADPLVTSVSDYSR
jgi:hypothetical protein